jgi:hypothetical protein
MEPRIQYAKTEDGVSIAYGFAMQKMMPKEAANAAS